MEKRKLKAMVRVALGKDGRGVALHWIWSISVTLT
jgi:hypothetical protein